MKENRLTILPEKGRGRDAKYNKTVWAKCTCGVVKQYQEYHVKNGNVRSCGCLAKEIRQTRNATHGMSRSRTYKIWQAMHHRCKRKKSYLEKRIAVCKRWGSFVNFFEDMGERPCNLSLDRIDNSKGYFKENCRWTTQKIQTRNTSRNKYYELNGEVKVLTDWCHEYKKNRGTVAYRLEKLNWGLLKSLTATPNRWEAR